MKPRARRHAGVLAAIIGVVLCLLVAQAHAGLHAATLAHAAKSSPHGPTQSPHSQDCQSCTISVWTPPVDSPHLQTPAEISWMEALPQLQRYSHDDSQPTAPRAPPQV